MNIFQKMGFQAPDEETVEEQGQEEKKETKTETGTHPAPPAQSKSVLFAAPQAAPSVPGQIVGQIDDGIYEILSAAIEENNLDGNDFLEFMKSLVSMSALTVAEDAKFQMVFTTLSTSNNGLTKEHLLGSIDHYLTVIGKEKATFASQMEGHKAENVDGEITKADNCDALAQQKLGQIETLQKEIQDLGVQSSELRTGAQETDAAISQKSANFETTSNQLITQITDYKTKIGNYIQ